MNWVDIYNDIANGFKLIQPKDYLFRNVSEDYFLPLETEFVGFPFAVMLLGPGNVNQLLNSSRQGQLSGLYGLDILNCLLLLF
jgi:hypothetical protein